MRESLVEAAILVLVGMAVVFAALVILMLAIMIVSRLTPEKARKGEAQHPAFETDVPGNEKIAAIAVALARHMEDSKARAEDNEIDVVLRSGEAGRWLTFGREQAMRSRRKVGRQWGRRSD